MAWFSWTGGQWITIGSIALKVTVLSLVAALVARACLYLLRGFRTRHLFKSKEGEELKSETSAPLAPGEYLDKQIRPTWILFSVICANRVFLPRWLQLVVLPELIAQALEISAIVSFSWLLLRAGRGLRLWLDDRFDISTPDNLRSRRMRTQIAFIERIFDVLVVVVSCAVVLAQFESGRRLSTGILASAGVASLVIGFAAQRTLANLLAGFQIAFTAPIRIDDAVVVENEWGWIEEISLTYVVVRVWDRRRLILPITYFVEKPFQNWTRKSGQILGSVMLEVAHHTPFDALNAELNRLLDNHALWDGDARVLQIVEMKERNIQMRALMTARSSPECWDLRCAVRKGLIEFLVREYPDCLPTARLQILTSEHSEDASVVRALREHS